LHQRPVAAQPAQDQRARCDHRLDQRTFPRIDVLASVMFVDGHAHALAFRMAWLRAVCATGRRNETEAATH
jgi:hypothetical protein